MSRPSCEPRACRTQAAECNRSTSSFSQADFGTDQAKISLRAATEATSHFSLANHIHLHFFQEIPLSRENRTAIPLIRRQYLGRGYRVTILCCVCAELLRPLEKESCSDIGIRITLCGCDWLTAAVAQYVYLMDNLKHFQGQSG